MSKLRAPQIDTGTGANNIVELDGSGNLPIVDGSAVTNVDAITLNGDAAGTGANQLVQLDGSSNLPAVDGSAVTNVDAITLGGLSVGTGANNIVQLNGSSQLPAVDGSLLTNLPVSVNVAVAGKNANTSKANDTTLAADPDLTASLAGLVGGKVYAFEMFLKLSGNNTNSFKFQITTSATTYNIDYTYNNSQGGVGTVDGGNQLVTEVITTASGLTNLVSIVGIVRFQETGTFNFNFDWAQNVSDPGNTILFQGSWLKITEIV